MFGNIFHQMALFGLPMKQIINTHRCVSWSGLRLIQYIYHYLQILFVSCFKMRKTRFVYLLGLGLIVYFFTKTCRHGDKRKFPLSTNLFQPVIFQTYQYFIVNQERMQHYMSVFTKIHQNVMGQL